jgi:hypothetical protein
MEMSLEIRYKGKGGNFSLPKNPKQTETIFHRHNPRENQKQAETKMVL